MRNAAGVGSVLEGETVLGLGSAELLARFAAVRDEAAFAALVAHHGPMVLATCRRILPHGLDADDAFQATFLILARRARSIADPDRLAPWLHGVARRVATRARGVAARRRVLEGDPARPDEVSAETKPVDDLGELRAILDEELARLPEKYRAPLVLCYLEGMTSDEAAGQLSWPVGTVRSRLAGGRDRLRSRLARRGFAPPVLATLAPSALPTAAVSPALLVATARLASAIVPKLAAPAAVILAQGVSTSMLLAKLQAAAAASLILAAGLGGLVAAQQPPAPAVAAPAPTPAAPATVPAADAPPTPSFTRIDYAHPQQYLALHSSFGDADHIRRLAAPLRADSAEKTLKNIARWIDRTLKYDPGAAYEFRDVDAACRLGVYGGCADHAIVFAALARACGIPAVFVKTMDVAWIREFAATGTCQVWSGHVFLEVFVNDRWRLLDASALELYDDYAPTIRILPGNRFAYDKGSDPRELVLSPDWERWKRQTAAYFARFDLGQLPVGSGREVGTEDDVYIAADSPIWQALTERCTKLGHKVRYSFNTDYDQALPRVRGKILIATAVDDRTVPPAGPYRKYLALTPPEISDRIDRDGAGVATKRLDDGTRLILLYARDTASLWKFIQTWEPHLEEIR